MDEFCWVQSMANLVSETPGTPPGISRYASDMELAHAMRRQLAQSKQAVAEANGASSDSSQRAAATGHSIDVALKGLQEAERLALNAAQSEAVAKEALAIYTLSLERLVPFLSSDPDFLPHIDRKHVASQIQLALTQAETLKAVVRKWEDQAIQRQQHQQLQQQNSSRQLPASTSTSTSTIVTRSKTAAREAAANTNANGNTRRSSSSNSRSAASKKSSLTITKQDSVMGRLGKAIGLSPSHSSSSSKSSSHRSASTGKSKRTTSKSRSKSKSANQTSALATASSSSRRTAQTTGQATASRRTSPNSTQPSMGNPRLSNPSNPQRRHDQQHRHQRQHQQLSSAQRQASLRLPSTSSANRPALPPSASTPTTTNPPSKFINSKDPLVQTVKSDLYVDPSQLQNTTWDDIAGLADAKQSLQEAAILPLVRPDLFTGLRKPRNILLYGPPGTGKTMLARAVAKESQCLLFLCTASALTSKWHGEGEKLVRTLFEVARAAAPSIIFVDEMDALLSTRKSDGEHEASRRFKTEFMTQVDGIVKGGGSGEGNGKHVLVIACTNCPWDIDSAVLRRFPRRIYIPLPDTDTRKVLVAKLLEKAGTHSLSSKDIKEIVKRTEGFSGSDLTSIASEASFGPLRDLGGMVAIRDAAASDIRPIALKDFTTAISQATKSVSPELLRQYDEWKQQQAAS